MIEEIKLASKFDAKGFKQAESASAKLGKTVKKLAGAFGVTFAASEVIQFGKESVKAFLEDEKAAAKLTSTINNLGLSLSADSLNRYVERLSLATGVVDDQLRPALQSLLQVTGSSTLSQKLLGQAVEISRGSQEDLLTVANDLSQAYVGNTKGLRKYNLGLTKAELQTASFATILDRFNKLFTGANAAYLETYAGKMQLLTVAAGEAKEVIGKGLVDGLVAVSGQQAGVQGTADAMMDMAQAVGDMSLGFGTLIGKLNSTPIVGDLLKAWGWIQNNTGILGSLRFLGEQERLKKERSMMPSGTVGSGIAQGALLQSNKVEKEALLRARELAKAAAAATKSKKEQLALEKQKAILEKASLALSQANKLFDDKAIQLAAASAGKLTDEDKIRIKLKQDIMGLEEAIQAGNVKSAASFASAIAQGSQQLQVLRGDLAGFQDIGNPFTAWLETMKALAAELAALAKIEIPVMSFNRGNTGMADFGGAAYELPKNPYAGTYYGETGRDPMPVQVTLNIDGKTVADALVNTSNSGTSSSTSRNSGQFS
jgi:hypothetical protein